MKRLSKRAGMVVAVVATALLGLTGTASAATGGGTVDTVNGAYGSANWTWHQMYLKPVNLAVKDTKCDGEPVFVQLLIFDGVGQQPDYSTTRRYNHKGCGETQSWSNKETPRDVRIWGVKVKVCVDGGPCDVSAMQYNPEYS